MGWKEQVKRFRLISSGAQSIAVGTVAFMVFTTISKILGFIREMVLAASFGTSWRLDAVIVALEPAESLSAIIAGAMATMMVPIYLQMKTDPNPHKTAQYASNVLKIAALALLVFSAALFFFPEILIRFFAPNFSGEILEYAARKLQVLAVLPLINGVGAIFTATLRAERRFIQKASFQLIFNIVSIPLLVSLAPLWSEAAYVFAWVAGAGVMNLCVVLYAQRFFDKQAFFSLKPPNHQARKTLIMAIPIIFGSSAHLINQIVDKMFASYLPEGRISALRYSQVLLTMITALIVGSFLTTTHTEISESAAKNDIKAIVSRLKKTHTDLIRLVTPLTFWIILMAEPLIRLLFQRGEFDAQSTSLVSGALIAYSIIIFLSPVSGLASNTIIALQRVNIIYLFSLISLSLNALFNWAFIGPFGHVGIAASTSLVGLISKAMYLGWLYRTYRIHFVNFRQIAILCAIFGFGFMILLMLQSIWIDWVWLLIGNSFFLLGFLMINRKLVHSLMKKIMNR